MLPFLGAVAPVLISLAIITASTAVIITILFLYQFKFKSRPPETTTKTLPGGVDARFHQDAILSAVDIGIVAYDPSGKLIYHNVAATDLLDNTNIPDDFERFMMTYCESNGIMARLLLGKVEAAGVLTIGRRVIRILVRNFRGGAKRLQANVVILQDITKVELQEQKRKEFVANVSHELKTPLTTIVTYSESLMDWGLEEKTKEGVYNDVKRIHEDAIRMQHLVTDLLLLSSIDSKALRIRMEPLDLAGLVRQTVEHMLIQADERKVDLSFTSLVTVPPVFGDRPSIERIVSNLVSNAIKYSDPGAEVKVYVGMVHDEAYLKVTDNGHGIEEANLNKIFDRFYRVDMTGSRIYGGTGLGLSIVKELVDMHGGQISVKSAVGLGTTFTIMLPLAITVHNKTLNNLQNGIQLRTLLQMASLTELINIAKECGKPVQNAADLTPDIIALLRNEITAEGVRKKEKAEPSAKPAPMITAEQEGN